MGAAAQPLDEQAREQNSQVEPALPRADVRMSVISVTQAVFNPGCELPLQEIRDEDRRLTNGPAPDAIATPRAQLASRISRATRCLVEQSLPFTQIEKHARCAVDAMICDERRANQSK